jgi:predicted phage-related endonuclease
MALNKSAEWHETRRTGVGGSDANILMSGDFERIHRLWQEKLGLVEPEDLSWVLPVQIGSVTEGLNAAFYAHATGREVTHRNHQMVAPSIPYMRCELDGMTTTASGSPAIWEAKHVNAFSNADEAKDRYLPQLHHNMHIAGAKWAVLSLFLGTQKHEVVEVERDDGYLMTLLDVEKRFWDSVTNKTVPEGFVPEAAPVPFEALRTVDMTGNNIWAMHAVDWLANKDAAKAHEGAAKALKSLIGNDVGKATGYGVQIKRNKAGSLMIGMDK